MHPEKGNEWNLKDKMIPLLVSSCFFLFLLPLRFFFSSF